LDVNSLNKSLFLTPENVFDLLSQINFNLFVANTAMNNEVGERIKDFHNIKKNLKVSIEKIGAF
jgi:hypothetical protein